MATKDVNDILADDTAVKDNTPTPEPEEKELDIDTTALQEEVKSTVSKQVLDEIVSKLRGDEKDDEEKAPWEREGRNPKSWKEVAEYGATVSEKRAANRAAEEAQKIKQSEEGQRQAQEEQVKQWNQMWDMEIASLQEEGALPKVSNRDDPNDSGVKAIRDLFEKATNLAKDGRLPSKSLVAAFHYTSKSKPEPPIFGSQNAMPSKSTDENYTYRDLHNSSFYDILQGQ